MTSDVKRRDVPEDDMKRPEVKIGVRRVTVSALDVSGPLVLYIYSVDELGSLDRLLAESFPVLTDSGKDTIFTCSDVETEETELGFVCASDGGKVASAIIQIDTNIFQSTISAKLQTLVPTFNSPVMTVDVFCIPLLVVRFVTNLVVVADLREIGCICPSRSEYELELRIVDSNRRTVVSRKSGSLQPVQVLHFSTLVSLPPLSLQLHMSSWDMDHFKAEIYVIHKRDNTKKLIDTIPLKRMKIGEAVLAGSCGEGQLVVSRTHESFVPINVPEALRLRNKESFETVRTVKCSLTLSGFPETLLGGHVAVTVIGSGFDPIVSAGVIATVVIRDAKVVIETETFEGREVPVVAVLVRDRTDTLKGLYTIPLMRSELVFPSDGLQVSVDLATDENVIDIIIPVVKRRESISVNEFATTRLQVLIEKVTGLNAKAKSCFVAVRVVQLSVPPVLLRSGEVLALQSYEQLDTRNVAITVTRENTANPIWQQMVEIDVFQWVSTDWLYFMLYDNTDNGTVLLGHTCLPLSCVRADPLVLPVVPVAMAGEDTGSVALTVSFPKAPMAWSAIHIQQPESHLVRSDGELKLTVEIFHTKEDEAAIRRGHMWLPIGRLLPLVLENCPPVGLIKLSLSRLNGVVVSESTHKFSSYNSLTCGRFEFLLTRIQS